MFSLSRVNKLIFDLIRQHLVLVVVTLILALGASCLELISASLVMPLLQSLDSENASLNTSQSSVLLQIITNLYINLPEKWRSLAIILSFLVITIAKNLNRYLSQIGINNFQLKTGFSLREKCVERLLKLETIYFDRAQLGKLLSYLNEHTQRIELLASYVLEIIGNILTINLLLFLLISISPTLTLIATISLVVSALMLKPLIQSAHFYGKNTANFIDVFSFTITEIISGIRIVKSFNTESKELARVRQTLEQRYQSELTGYKYQSAVAPLTETAGITVLLILLTVGTVILPESSGTKMPLLLTYTFALLRILPRITHLNSLRSQISLFSGSLEVVQHFLLSTEKLPLLEGNLIFAGIQSELTFEEVTFTFPEKSEPAVKKVNLRIPKGTTTAIVGLSGSGKSTIADLIMRFHDPETGSIKVDGVDLREFQLSSWRRSIATVSQDTFLFHGSIQENIAYGCPEASKAEIMEAAKKAYAYEFIQELPERFDTVVGNRGTKLSGGQRQRIAIARAILCNPDILILDEATSALDSNSERIVQKALEDISCDRTVIVIAHRLSTIEKADSIVVLRDGRVIEQGTHQQLLANRGEYSSLYSFQLFSQKAL
jgi:ABC-type multidrug transport system fused ATPase/permease subunit